VWVSLKVIIVKMIIAADSIFVREPHSTLDGVPTIFTALALLHAQGHQTAARKTCYLGDCMSALSL
jgi:hypothetical protein